MLGQRPADAYRAYQSRSSGSRRSPPPRKRRGRVAEMAIIGLMVLAGLFVVVVGFWAVTLDGGREAEPEVQPTPTLGERPQNMLRVLVQSEAGEPFPAALVEFRDRLDQVVATQLTDQDGHAEALVTVGDYSVAVRIPGYEVARLPDLVVTAQDAPRHTVTVQPAQRGASAAPTAGHDRACCRQRGGDASAYAQRGRLGGGQRRTDGEQRSADRAQREHTYVHRGRHGGCGADRGTGAGAATDRGASRCALHDH